MSPFPGLDKPISLQAWGYQLKVDNADDGRIDEFITTLRENASLEPAPPARPATTPPAPVPRRATAASSRAADRQDERMTRCPWTGRARDGHRTPASTSSADARPRPPPVRHRRARASCVALGLILGYARRPAHPVAAHPRRQLGRGRLRSGHGDPSRPGGGDGDDRVPARPPTLTMQSSACDIALPSSRPDRHDADLAQRLGTQPDRPRAADGLDAGAAPNRWWTA